MVIWGFFFGIGGFLVGIEFAMWVFNIIRGLIFCEDFVILGIRALFLTGIWVLGWLFVRFGFFVDKGSGI